MKKGTYRLQLQHVEAITGGFLDLPTLFVCKKASSESVISLTRAILKAEGWIISVQSTQMHKSHGHSFVLFPFSVWRVGLRQTFLSWLHSCYTNHYHLGSNFKRYIFLKINLQYLVHTGLTMKFFNFKIIFEFSALFLMHLFRASPQYNSQVHLFSWYYGIWAVAKRGKNRQ